MNREQIIAMLNKLAIKFDDKADDLALAKLLNDYKPTAPAPAPTPDDGHASKIISIENKLKELAELENRAKTDRVTRAVDQLIVDDKLAAASRDTTVAAAIKDESILTILNAQPANPPGHVGLKPAVGITSEAFVDVQKHVASNTYEFMSNFIFTKTGSDELGPKVLNEITARSVAANRAIEKHKDKIVAMWNTNTIAAGMQRQVILMDLLRAFKQRILVLTAFCKTFNSVPLEGTNKINVPYFPLQTAASTTWNATNGYVAGDTTEDTREINVSNRKYQAMQFSSSELRRQPYQNWQQLAVMNAEKLATDVNQDVMSAITAANYGTAALTLPAAAFNADSVVDLQVAATDANWPMSARSLVLTSSYYGSLLKDPSFKSALSYGSSDPIQLARINNAYGFENIFNIPASLIPSNSENLVGWINHLNAVLVATSPIMPTPDVRALMTQYDIMVDPDLGIALEYRRFGNPQLDVTTEVVECNYGYAKGVGAALQRIVSA